MRTWVCPDLESADEYIYMHSVFPAAAFTDEEAQLEVERYDGVDELRTKEGLCLATVWKEVVENGSKASSCHRDQSYCKWGRRGLDLGRNGGVSSRIGCW